MIYASKYYDPVKAHAYYEAHKHLKGRHSTRGMDEHQKQMAAYVKSKLDTDKSSELRRAAVKSQGRAGEKRKQLSEACSARINSLKLILENMPESERNGAKALIESRIREIRGEYGKRKKQVTKNFAAALRNDTGNIRKKYSDRYAAALSMLRGGNNG